MFGIASDHKAGYVLKKNDRQSGLIAIHDKTCGFVGAVRVDDAAHLNARLLCADLVALIGHDPDRMSVDTHVGRDERLSVVGLVFIERIRVDNRGEQITRIVLLLAVEADQVVDRIWIPGRRERLFRGVILFRRFGFRQMRHKRTESLQAGWVIFLVKVDRAAHFGVHVGAAQLLSFDDLADGGFDQGRTSEIKAAALGHEHLVAKHREIGAPATQLPMIAANCGCPRRRSRSCCERSGRSRPRQENFVLHGRKTPENRPDK